MQRTVAVRAAVAAGSLLLVTGMASAQGGDDPARATPVPGLPYTDTGTTTGLTDVADAACPSPAVAPDAWYVYVPPRDLLLSIDLCDAAYFARTYVLDATLTPVVRADGTDACASDGCPSGGLRPQLRCVPLEAGRTYYLVVDGSFDGDAGDYALSLGEVPTTECPPCDLACPPDATPEGETCSFEEPAPDTFNGGCNASPPVFSPITCGETVCGQSTFNGRIRDTDWYALDLTDLTLAGARVGGVAEFSSVFALTCHVGDPVDCAPACGFDAFALGDPCEPVEIDIGDDLDPGTINTIFVAANFTEIVDCNGDDADYVLWLECTTPPPPCPWDLDGDGVIGFSDLLGVLSNWGPCPTSRR